MAASLDRACSSCLGFARFHIFLKSYSSSSRFWALAYGTGNTDTGRTEKGIQYSRIWADFLSLDPQAQTTSLALGTKSVRFITVIRILRRPKREWRKLEHRHVQADTLSLDVSHRGFQGIMRSCHAGVVLRIFQSSLAITNHTSRNHQSHTMWAPLLGQLGSSSQTTRKQSPTIESGQGKDGKKDGSTT